MFGSSSSLPKRVGQGGGLVLASVGKADLLSDHFNSKRFAFRSREDGRFLDLDTDPYVCFPLSLKITADVLVPCFSVGLRLLVRLGSFPAC